MKRYKFNLVDDENIEDFNTLPSAPKKRYLEAPEWYDDENNENDEDDINTSGTSPKKK